MWLPYCLVNVHMLCKMNHQIPYSLLVYLMKNSIFNLLLQKKKSTAEVFYSGFIISSCCANFYVEMVIANSIEYVWTIFQII